MDKSRRKILILTGNADFRHETGRRMYNPQKAHKLWTEKGLLKILKENSSTADIGRNNRTPYQNRTKIAIIGFLRSEGKPRAHFLPSPNESRRLALPKYQL